MPIVGTDIKYYLSGGAANSDPNAALGGAISSTEIGAGLHNLFDVVGSAEAAAGDTEYRCIYVKNTHGTLTLQNAVAWIQSAATLGVEVALAGEGINGTAETPADEDTAPVGESFTTAANKGSGLNIGDLAPGDYIGIWVKRICGAAQAALSGDSATIRTEGDTAG